MINSIGSSANSLMTQNGGMRRPPPPQEDVFQLTDDDGNGSVSADELTTLANSIQEVSGTIVDVGEALSNYDLNKDGELSGEELFEMMKGYGFAPPEPGMDVPTAHLEPPSVEQAHAAYEQNSGTNQIAQLIELLTKGEEENGYTAINTQS